MNVTMLLADSAQVADGKLYVLGGGWTHTGPDPAPMAIAAVVEVAWDQANVRHHFELSLTDEDGRLLELGPTPGATNVRVDGEFEVGRPPGSTQGADLNFPLALNFGPLPLPTGRRLVWSMQIGEGLWSQAFNTRPPAGP